MRNMSNIPKLPAHAKRSRCSGMKVPAHNKEVCGRALTSQRLPYSAATDTGSARYYSCFCVVIFGYFHGKTTKNNNKQTQNKTVFFDRKTRNAKYEFGMKSARGGKRTQRRGVETHDTQKFCGFRRKLLP